MVFTVLVLEKKLHFSAAKLGYLRVYFVADQLLIQIPETLYYGFLAPKLIFCRPPILQLTL